MAKLLIVLLAASPALVHPREFFRVPPAPPGVVTLLENAENLVYSERGTTREIEGLLQEARQILQRQPDTPQQKYWKARIQLLLGSHLNVAGESRRAARELQEGFRFLEEALAAGEFSEGLRVEADLHSQMMISRGLIYMMRNGERARDAAFRARELDGENVRALISVAGFYLNAPPFAGGDVAQGIAVLERALALNPDNQNDRFMIYGWLAEAYGNQNRHEDAREALARARAIYPESPWLQRIRES